MKTRFVKILSLLMIFIIACMSIVTYISTATEQELSVSTPETEALTGAVGPSTNQYYSVHHNMFGSDYHIYQDGETPADVMSYSEAMLKISYLEANCNCQSYFRHIKHPGCSLSDGWANVKTHCAHYQMWDELFSLTDWWAAGSSDLNYYSKSELIAKLKEWLVELDDDMTISEVMDFLNDENFDLMNSGSTGLWMLYNNASFFCLKHGQAIGRFHSFLVRDHADNIDISKYVDVNYSTGYAAIPTQPDTSDYADSANSEIGRVQTLKSNVKYFCGPYQNIYTINNSFGTYSTNIFAYAEAYAQKYLPQYRGGIQYNQERTQQTIWAVVGDPGRGTPNTTVDVTAADGRADDDTETVVEESAIKNQKLWDCGAALDVYEKILTGGTDQAAHDRAVSGAASNLDKPTVSVVTNSLSDRFVDKTKIGGPTDSTGTTIYKGSDNEYYYKIGPFTMSDYALAFANDDIPISLFSGSACSIYQQMLGGIEKGTVTFNNGTTLEIGDKVTVVYTDMNGNDTNKGYDRSSSYIFTPAPSQYQYPLPGSTFYLTVKKSDVGNATTLNTMTFNYRQTCADGHGWVITSKYVRTTWKCEDTGAGCSNYHCNGCYCSGHSVPDGTDSQGHTKYKTEYRNDNCACRRNHSQGYVGPKGDQAVCNGHNHKNCRTSKWSNESVNIIQGQPFLAVHDAEVTVGYTPRTSTVNVRLTTNVSIDKYIYDTWHNMPDELAAEDGDKRTAGKTGINTSLYMAEGETRANRVNAVKRAAPVYLEYGDTVIYKIKLKNTQDQKVEVKLRDELPANCNLVSIVNTTTGVTFAKDDQFSLDGNVITFGKWIEINGNSTTELTVTVLVKEMTQATLNEIWENKATIITNNAGWLSGDVYNVDCMRTTGNGRPGPVVNLSTQDTTHYHTTSGKLIPTSSDWYKFDDYTADIHKYISKYNAEVTTINNDTNNEHKMKITNETNDPALVVDSSKDPKAKEYYTRFNYTEVEKESYPLAVEQNETFEYQIMVVNEDVNKLPADSTPEDMKASATGKAKQVRPTQINDYLQVGLQMNTSRVTAKIYDKNGNPVTRYGSSDGSVSVRVETGLTANSGYNGYKFIIGNETILNPGDYIVYTVPVTVVESNMYLYSLSNEARLAVLTNINHQGQTLEQYGGEEKKFDRIIKDGTIDDNFGREISKEYVRLKDLVISGRVWLDRNKDGIMDYDPSTKRLSSSIDVDTNPSSYIRYTDGYEKAMEGIVVNLYQIDPDTRAETKIRTVKTNSEGIYSFGYAENSKTAWRDGTYSITRTGGTLKATDSDQRVDKAKGKDATTQKYPANSKLYSYYIEFEYDGIVYKSTEVYSGTDHLKNDGSMNTEDQYVRDSNADEFKDVRDTFDAKHEIVGYNHAAEGTNSTNVSLEYEKDGHNSYLRIDHNRIMTARSFLMEYNKEEVISACETAINSCGANRWKECSNHWKHWKVLIDMGIIDDAAYPNTAAGRDDAKAYLRSVINELRNRSDQKITNYLWLYHQDSEYQYPKTEYLKYINLGLEEREDIDISLVQDVYELHDTVNGEEMRYWYNQNSYAKDGSSVDHDASITSAFSNEFFMTGYQNDGSALTPYEFKYYLADYNYKVDDYEIKSVRDYKTQYSELDSEIYFRIKVTNNAITDDEPKLEGSKKDIKVYAGINEVVEYFDEDFMDITYNADGTVNTLIVKTKDEDGYLINTEYKVADAYFVTPSGTKIPAEMVGYNTSNSPITLTATSMYNETYKDVNGQNGADFRATLNSNGYHTVYIRPNSSGINKVILAEGENVDIIVKFTIDKDSSRNIKLGLKTAIAEVSAYSTYYKEGSGYISAGLVDRDSNAGNFGKSYTTGTAGSGSSARTTYEQSANGTVKFSKDTDSKANDPYLAVYEDDTYKTGITLGKQEENERIIEGQAWDDARSEEAQTTSGGTATDGAQYIGDGKNGTVSGVTNAAANTKAKINKIFKTLATYGSDENKEKNDFVIDDVGVKLVEIVRVPVDSSGNIIADSTGTIAEERIYEETIRVNDDKSIVETRTGLDGAATGHYALKGYIPGEYIVRFFYGDSTSEAMMVFNGQDYKSTTYQAGVTYAEHNYLKNGSEIVKDKLGNPKFDTDAVLRTLETEGLSDAKDDELRRLEGISYSETLNNNKTLVLRGVNSTNKELQMDETNMNAETVDFLVRAEKYEKAKTYLTYSETMQKITNPGRHPIENLDFGLQYRPEQQVALNKFVKNIQVITSNNRTGEGTTEYLVDAKFNEFYGIVANTNLETGVTSFVGYNSTDADGNTETVLIDVLEETGKTDIKDVTPADVERILSNHGITDTSNIAKNKDGNYQLLIAGTKIDEENSIGISNLQYVQNEAYDRIGGMVSYKDTHDDASKQGFVYLNIDDEIMQGAQIKVDYLFVGNNISEIDRVNKNLSILRFRDNLTENNVWLAGSKDDGVTASLTFGGNTYSSLKEYYDNDSTVNYDSLSIDAGRTTGAAVGSLVTRINSYGENKAYSGALTARNAMFNEYYRHELVSTSPAVAAKYVHNGEESEIIYRVKHKTIGDTTNDYYGRYLGSTYYTGKVGANDVVSELKVDEILDYIDNNLVFESDDNTIDTVNRFWRSTTASELVLGGYVQPTILSFEKKDIDAFLQAVSVMADSDVKDALKILQYNEVKDKFEADTVENAINAIQRYSDSSKLRVFLDATTDVEFAAIKPYTDLLSKGLLLDSEGVAYNTDERTNLAVLQDLRTSDRQSDDTSDAANYITNADITKYLSPRDSESSGSYGTIEIMASKVIAAEDDTKDMVYENVGEVIEYSSVTGRVTNLSTTLGNVELSYEPTNSENPDRNSSEYQDSKNESDTAAVEKITLTPPTGLNRTRQIINTVVKGASYTGIIIAVIAVAVFGTFGGIKLYRKRRIK